MEGTGTRGERDWGGGAKEGPADSPQGFLKSSFIYERKVLIGRDTRYVKLDINQCRRHAEFYLTDRNNQCLGLHLNLNDLQQNIPALDS